MGLGRSCRPLFLELCQHRFADRRTPAPAQLVQGKAEVTEIVQPLQPVVSRRLERILQGQEVIDAFRVDAAPLGQILVGILEGGDLFGLPDQGLRRLRQLCGAVLFQTGLRPCKKLFIVVHFIPPSAVFCHSAYSRKSGEPCKKLACYSPTAASAG